MITFLAWHNILFLSSIVVGVLIAIGASTGGFDMDTDMGTDVAGGLDVDADMDGAKHGVMSWLDMGRIPFTVLLMVSTLVFGIVGIAGSFVSVSILGVDTGWLGGVWVLIAFVAMIFMTTRIARSIIKHIPASETHVVSKSDLVGVTATMCTSNFADAVRRNGTVHRLECVCEFATLEAGMDVEVVSYDPDTEIYSVSPVTTA